MATITTSTSETGWSPDLYTYPALDVIPDALVLTTSTVTGEIEGDEPAVRVPYIDDDTAGFFAEGADIDESDPDLNEVLVHTGKIAQLVRLSNEQWRQEHTPESLADSVERAVTKAANIAYLAQAAPTSPAVTPPAGLLNVAGIGNGGAVAANLDALIDLVAQLQSNGSDPSHILLDPVGWARLRKFKTASGAEVSLLGAGTTDAARYLLDLPVIVTPAMPTATGLVVDDTAVVSAVGDVRVAVSEHLFFKSDSVALRCTFRFGQNVVRPDRIGKFTIGADDESSSSSSGT